MPESLSSSSVALTAPNSPLRRFLVAAVVLTLAFALPLHDWVRFALRSQLFSHIILIPCISGYLIWLRRKSLPTRFVADPMAAIIPVFLGALALGGYGLSLALGAKLPVEDRLALTISSYILLLLGLGAGFLGRELLKALVFPLAFLVFAPPLPVAVVDLLETVLQHGSAEVVAVMLSLSGMPVFRDGLSFQMPGITLRVAQECSGIHSTLALFITSIVGGYLFLKRPINRVWLAAAVLPLALLRNGFRVFVIAQLCVRISPDMVHSYIHRQGGPIFFALSLIPFGFFLWWLRHREKVQKAH